VRKISDFPVHRTFARVRVEIGWCDVCGEKRAVYRSREAQAKVCEVRRFAEPEHEKPSGFEGVTRGWCGSGIGGRG